MVDSALKGSSLVFIILDLIEKKIIDNNVCVCHT